MQEVAKRCRRAVLTVVVLLLVVTGVVELGSTPVNAAVLGYPHATKPCIWAPYNIDGLCMHDGRVTLEWGDRRNDSSGANIFSERGYAYRNCTDYVAWKLQSLGVPDAKTRGLGNGGEWYDRAGLKGLPRGDVPAVGAIAVKTGGLGHVVYVEAVNANGTITVSDYNYSYDGTGGTRTINPVAAGFTKFVYFANFMANPPSGGARPAAAPHLYVNHHWDTHSGQSEARVLNGQTNYTSWVGGWVTPDGWHGGDAVDYAMADANGDGVQDMYKVQYCCTHSGRTEVQILNGATNFTTWVGGWVMPIPYHGAGDAHYTVGNYDADNKPDLYVIVNNHSPSGRVEVKVLSGASNFAQWIGGWVTPEGWHDGNGVEYALSSCGTGGRPHLYQILHSFTSSGHTEVRQFDAAANYTTYVGGWVTADGWHSGNDVHYTAGGCNTNGKPNIYSILHQNTHSGFTEVRVLNGAANFSSWTGGWATPDGLHSSYGIDYVMPAS